MNRFFAAALVTLLLGAPALAAEKAAPPPARKIQLEVTSDGFVPAEVKVKKGERLELVVTRKTDRTCATQMVIKDENIKVDLPLNKPVSVPLTPRRSGDLRYACGMDMIAGVLKVE